MFISASKHPVKIDLKRGDIYEAQRAERGEANNSILTALVHDIIYYYINSF